LSHEIAEERHSKVSTDLETTLTARLHSVILSSKSLGLDPEHLARGACGGEFPGQSRVFGMESVNEEIYWLSVIAGEVGEPADAMKIPAPGDKRLRTPIGDMDGAEKMRYAGGFPVLASGLPQVQRQMSAVG